MSESVLWLWWGLGGISLFVIAIVMWYFDKTFLKVLRRSKK